MKSIKVGILTPNPKNPDAVKTILEMAQKTLATIPGLNLQCGVLDPKGHSFGAWDGSIVTIVHWDSVEQREIGLKSPQIIEWCRFLSRGWKGSVDKGTKWEEICYEDVEGPVWMVRDKAIPESEVCCVAVNGFFIEPYHE